MVAQYVLRQTRHHLARKRRPLPGVLYFGIRAVDIGIGISRLALATGTAIRAPGKTKAPMPTFVSDRLGVAGVTPVVWQHDRIIFRLYRILSTADCGTASLWSDCASIAPREGIDCPAHLVMGTRHMGSRAGHSVFSVADVRRYVAADDRAAYRRDEVGASTIDGPDAGDHRNRLGVDSSWSLLSRSRRIPPTSRLCETTIRNELQQICVKNSL